METLIGVVIFIVISVLSIAQKMKEQRDLKRKLDREDVEERAREMGSPVEESVPTAQPRQPRRRGTIEMPQDVEDVIRHLMGQAPRPQLPTAEADEEGEWESEPPPIRPEVPKPAQQERPRQPPAPRPQRASQQTRRPQPAQRVPRPAQQQSARPERQRPARTPAEMMSTRPARPRQDAESITPEEIEQRENEKRWREESERRKRQEQAAQRQQKQQAAPGRPTRRVARTSRRRLFHDLAEVRRAIVMSEVISAPRAMNDLEPRA